MNPATAVASVVAGFPSPALRMQAYSFTVTAVDAYGRQATSYRGTVKLLSDDALVYSDGYTFTDADAGIHVFTTAFHTAGTHYLRAEDVAPGSLFGVQDGIVAVP